MISCTLYMRVCYGNIIIVKSRISSRDMCRRAAVYIIYIYIQQTLCRGREKDVIFFNDDDMCVALHIRGYNDVYHVNMR